ncbi:hypothetical protein PENTCL1PPCAC_4290 [Pristionchus entomophagus]|uniref:Gamma-glutamyltranspeptidase n=1 Tax=Pristionchus entomophagus TaxID=358040 RepID=A0AAV5SGZ3_9BILA|nr:hypothetical protein PENTCL1PPCAC_4290 [Pristionchus entomophagus]
MPARFLKTAYEPPHNGLVEMRKRGLPWLAASSILIIFVLVGSVAYLFMRDQHRGIIDQDPLFATSKISNRTTATTEVVSAIEMERLKTPLPTQGAIPEELEEPESKPQNPLDLESEEETEQRQPANTEPTITVSEDGTSAIPWLEDSTPSEEEEEPRVESEVEEEVEVTIVVPIVLSLGESSEEEDEPLRGDYPDDYYRRTSSTTTMAAPTAAFVRELTSTTQSPFESSVSSTTTPAAAASRTTMSPSSSRTPVLPLSEFSRAAITATNEICADIARNILMSGGNAIDAAIAGAFCLGGVEPHAAGLGGGLMMTVYQKASGRCEVVNGREAAPMGLDTAEWERNPRSREHGYTSVAVPGALHAMLSAYRRFRSGRVEWAELIQPTIQLVEHGFPVSASLAEALNYRAAEINETAGMRDIFLPNGLPIKEGSVLRDARLADTLRKIATSRDPSHLFYRGELAERIVHEIKAKGGHISKSDLVLFSSSIEDALTVELASGSRLCGPLPPSSFPALQAGLRVMENNSFSANLTSSTNEDIFAHYLIEATKVALSLRDDLGDSVNADRIANLTSLAFIVALAEEIGESAAKSERVMNSVSDVSTAHLNVVDENGNAVAVTMGLNRQFGSLRRSESLGFVWNNALSAFSHQSQGHPNSLQPKKRPATGAMPFVMVNGRTEEVELVGGATGDGSSFSALLATLSRLIIRGEQLDEAVAAPRIDAASGAFESGALVHVRSLGARGHSLSPLLGRPFGAATALVKRDSGGRLAAVCDPRGRVDRCARGI